MPFGSAPHLAEDQCDGCDGKIERRDQFMWFIQRAVDFYADRQKSALVLVLCLMQLDTQPSRLTKWAIELRGLVSSA